MHLNRSVRRLRAAVAAGGVAVLAVGLAACGSSDASGGSSSGSPELTVATTGPVPAFWNPYDPGSATTTFLDPVYDTLIHYGKDGELEPWLATSWEFTDPTTLQLKLRDDVTFTDGAKFDAETVKANFEYAIDKKANQGDQVFLANIASMTVVDPTTIDLTLTQPNPALPYDFTQLSGYMASPKALAAPDGLQQEPVGSGPYVLDTEATRPGVSVVYTRNEDYWAADQDVFPYDKVTFSIIADPTAAKNAAATGEVDALVVQPGTEISGFEQVTSLSGEQAGMTGAWLDTTGTTAKALGDERVRQALNYAIDREKLGQAAYQDTAIAVPGVPVTDGEPAYTDELGALYPYDPAKAKQLLADAGYADGFEMTMISVPQADQFAQAIAGQLEQVGVTVKVETHAADLVQAVQSGTRSAGLVLQRLTGDAGQDLANAFDPNTFFNVHHGSAPEVTDLLQQAAQTTDESARNTLYQQAAVAGAESSWYIATLVLQTVTAYDGDVVSVEPPDRGAIHLYDYHLPS
ncbi:Putative ABC-type dipeptide transport system, extracellular component [Modestobacter italicus]|uniref:Glutathione-binding protein GsiB n=1 Tax=Modestobacter italicus (strain DSM 44449 / CECT 9708 / BC 501) TaxID=2732864 RepID=I4EXR2_MODI5|nr:ABC transporter substrate-binding protein [Modestobacter marinus]CCH88175.1 Putative ABC-type dipeptide transport system, extracellular component [Modestobacter marinus]